jgi:hypothetical protein
VTITVPLSGDTFKAADREPRPDGVCAEPGHTEADRSAEGCSEDRVAHLPRRARSCIGTADVGRVKAMFYPCGVAWQNFMSQQINCYGQWAGTSILLPVYSAVEQAYRYNLACGAGLFKA